MVKRYVVGGCKRAVGYVCAVSYVVGGLMDYTVSFLGHPGLELDLDLDKNFSVMIFLTKYLHPRINASTI